jgi:hypothetical protein
MDLVTRLGVLGLYEFSYGLDQAGVPFIVIIFFPPSKFSAAEIGEKLVPDHDAEIDRNAVIISITGRGNGAGVMVVLKIKTKREGSLGIHRAKVAKIGKKMWRSYFFTALPDFFAVVSLNAVVKASLNISFRTLLRSTKVAPFLPQPPGTGKKTALL